MKRKIYKQLLKWKESKDRKPLMLRKRLRVYTLHNSKKSSNS